MDWALITRVLELSASIAVVVGIWVAALQLRAVNRQETREFENLYVQRYWTLMDQLSADYRLRGRRRKLSDSDRSTLLSYLQLCEDEADLHELRRISEDTWLFWASGMAAMLKDPAIRAVLDEAPESQFTTLRRQLRDGTLARATAAYAARHESRIRRK